jgi:predicted PolB exonuclease-like 3'-5' exonuclease
MKSRYTEKTIDNIVIFDIETIPDIEVAYDLCNLDKTIEYEVSYLRQEMTNYHLKITEGKNDFIRQPFHKVVCISYIECRIETIGNSEYYDLIKIDSMSAFKSSEEDLIKKFWHILEHKKCRFITFNGKNFDIPVLKYRAMKYGICCPWLFEGGKWDSYVSKYSDYNLDLIDILSDYGSSSKIKMSEVCALFKIPCKLDGNGSSVNKMFDENKHQEIRDYCESDVLATYLIYLRFSLFAGKINKHYYNICIEKLEQYLLNSAKDKMKVFLNKWYKMNNNKLKI